MINDTPAPVAEPGTVLLAHNFDDPSIRSLPDTSTDGYRDSEYVVQIQNPTNSPFIGLPGTYRDVSIAVDVRTVAGTRLPNLNCRVNGGSLYRLLLDRSNGAVRIARFDSGEQTILLDFQRSPAIRAGNEVNRLELMCAGALIAAFVNGTAVGWVRDDSYTEGGLAIGIGGPAGLGENRFDNLVVTARSETEPAPVIELQPTPTAPPTAGSPGPGDVLAIDNFDDASQGWLPASSPLPDSFSVEYAGGEYVARIIRPDRLYQAVLRGTYRDASIEIDARISGDPRFRIVYVGCRRGPGMTYSFGVEPAQGIFRLARHESSGQVVPLVDWSDSAAVRGGNEVNHLQLSCVGASLSAAVNGVTVATASDGAFPDGQTWIGFSSRGGVLEETSFDNLRLTQR